MNIAPFIVHPTKAKHIYEVRNDNTSIDNFVSKLKKEFDNIFQAISVRGLSGGKNIFNFKQLSYGYEQKPLIWESNDSSNFKLREYYLKLYVNHDKVPFRICNMQWVAGELKGIKMGNEIDFHYNIDTAFQLLEKFLKHNCKYFKISVFCGILPYSSWPSRSYIKIIIKLPVSSNDLFRHAGISNFTDFGQTYIKEISDEFCRIIDSENHDLEMLFNNKLEREAVARKAENIVRSKLGLKNVGDAFVNETLLANIINKIFPDTIRQFNPSWIGKYLIDIYIPSLKIGIEYHGIQHYFPVERFGGQEKLLKQQERDQFVREQCKKYNVRLIEWHYLTKVTEHNVYELLSQYIDMKKYIPVKTLFD